MDEKFDDYYLYGVKVKMIYKYRQGNTCLYMERLNFSKSILCIYKVRGKDTTCYVLCVSLG